MSHDTCSISHLKRRVAAAVVLPTAVVLFMGTRVFQDGCYLVLQRDVTTWLAIVSVAILVATELSLLVTMSHWICAKGDFRRVRAKLSCPQRLDRVRGWRLRAVVVAGAVGLGLATSELALRLFDIQPARTLWPGDFPEEHSTVNALGLRESWESLPDDGRLRVAMLGDSFVYGYGVKERETFCHLLEDQLSVGRAKGVATINLGYPGSAPGEQLEHYLELRDQLHPDVVVHVIYLNDFGMDLRSVILNIRCIAQSRSWLADQSYLWRHIEKQYDNWRAWNETLAFFRGGRDDAQREQSWRTFAADVRASRRAVEAGGARYCMVVFPWLFQLNHYPLKDVHDRIGGLAAEMRVPFLDLLEVFEGRDEASLRVNPIDEHPNASAHGIASRRIARFLMDEVLPARP